MAVLALRPAMAGVTAATAARTAPRVMAAVIPPEAAAIPAVAIREEAGTPAAVDVLGVEAIRAEGIITKNRQAF